jgi:oligopeptide transport system substrate-binding protein
MRITNVSAFLLIILSTVTFYSCEKVQSQYEVRVSKGGIDLGGTLSVAVSNDVNGYLPNQISDATSSEVGLHLHEGLLKLDSKTLKVIPALAKSWSVDNAGTSYVFTLRNGVKFHADKCFGNGSREITAHDFEYSFRQLCSADVEKAFETTFRNRVLGANEFHDGTAETIAGITVIDDYTLKIDLFKADPSFLFVLAQPSTTVISKKAVDQYGVKTTVGAGPFEFNSSEDGLILVRNTEYYQKDAFDNRLPYTDTLIFRTIATKEGQLNAFLEGEVDIVSGLYLDPVKQILEAHVADFSGQTPKYVMQRESESVGYESYSIYRPDIKGFENNFMGYRDFLSLQIEQ